MIFNEINLSCFQKYFIHSFEKRDSLAILSCLKAIK